MPDVAPGIIAIATSVISYYKLDADGKAVGDVITYQKGDVIHDEAEVQDLHARHFHHALTPAPHHEHLCPADCAVLAAAKAPAAIAPVAPAPPPQSTPSLPAQPAAADSEVK